jgi:hypothetical protein
MTDTVQPNNPAFALPSIDVDPLRGSFYDTRTLGRCRPRHHQHRLRAAEKIGGCKQQEMNWGNVGAPEHSPEWRPEWP